MQYSKVANNPLKTRADLQTAVRDLCEPLMPFFSEGGAMIRLAGAGTRHGPVAEGFETFARLLWGLVPLAAGGGDFGHWDLFVRGFTHGPDASHPEYWCQPTWGAQQHVEMAVVGLGLALAPEKIWTPLSPEARERLNNWLLSINSVDLPKNNWCFFRVLVNVGLRKVGARYDAAALEKTLVDIENYYRGDGWYSDGLDGFPCDYYSSFALQFYALIYATVAADTDPVRAKLYRDRARLFARDFIHWQDGEGAMLPYGRSLIYRFAEAAFWSAFAFAGIDDVYPLGVVKGLVLRHLRWWLRKPIFNEHGLLSVGYGYPNLLMAESYNGPGSPYWAFKTFLIVALPETHPFWQAEELPLPELPARRPMKHPGMMVCRNHAADLTVALTCGPVTRFEHSHRAEKYMKFAYAPQFGICVPTEGVTLDALGHDNALALSEEGDYWRVRREFVRNGLVGETLWSQWKPWADVEVTTWVWPEGDWHVRVHHIRTARALQTAEGGFAIARAWLNPLLDDEFESPQQRGLRVRIADKASTVLDLVGNRTASRINPLPNSHLDFSDAHIPTLRGQLAPGEHWLAAAFLPQRGKTTSTSWAGAPVLDLARKKAELLALL